MVFDSGAMAEAIEAADYMAGFSPDHADAWFNGLRGAVESLAVMPAMWGRAREAASLSADLRQMLYRSHRIIFRIEESTATVRVLHVRHASRQTLGQARTADDVDEQEQP